MRRSAGVLLACTALAGAARAQGVRLDPWGVVKGPLAGQVADGGDLTAATARIAALETHNVSAQTGMFSCALAASGGVSVLAEQCTSLGEPTDGASSVYAMTSNVVANGNVGDRVALYGRAISQSGTAGVWGANTVTDCLFHADGTHAGVCVGTETDVDEADCDAGPSPGTITGCPRHSMGLWLTGLAIKPVTDAVYITAQNFDHPQWHYGVRADGPSIDTAFLYDASNAATSFFMAGTHQSGIDFSTALFEASGSSVPGTGAAIRLTNEQYLCFHPDCTYKLGYSGTLGAPGFVYGGGTQSVLFPSDGGVYATGPGVFSRITTGGTIALTTGAQIIFDFGISNASGPILGGTGDGLTLQVNSTMPGGGNLAVEGNIAAAAISSATITATGNAVVNTGAALVFNKSGNMIGSTITGSADGNTVTLSSTGAGNLAVKGGVQFACPSSTTGLAHGSLWCPTTTTVAMYP